jgi:serine/threonine protein kinase/beta-lactam-binding protein with PASTA domain
MDPYIGKVLDSRYEILERIGTGGMAIVYKARDHRLNRLIAIKILKSDLAQDEDFRRRFNAESQAVAQLSHPNIVSVYDVSKSGEVEYIVMELIDGITLKQYMEKRGQLSWRESLHFITQIMRGLSHAHSRGIVHRDIKPQNIMVLRDGSVKVTDFGIACLENSAQTLTQEALGSVHYISPEQARGDRTDARSDIYSAGVVLYEMLTNRLPFEGDSAVSVAIQHLSSIPLAPREVNPDIPVPLELICMKAMAPDLEKRYASADAMIEDLESFRKNPGVSLDFAMDDLRPDETDEPTRLLHTPHPSAAAVRRAPAQGDEYEDAASDTPASRKKRRQRAVVTSAIIVAALVVIALLFRFILSSFGAANQEYTVPDIVGKTQEQAEAMTEVKGIFQLHVAGEETSEEYAKDQILRQDPASGEIRKGENLTIDIWISSGEPSGKMIDVVDKDARDAEKVLLKDLIDKYNLTVTTEEAYSDEYNEGRVISSSPAAGETLKKGDTILLTVSKGPEIKSTTVPSFVGQNIDKVTKELETVWKLKLGKVTKEDSDKPAGEILSQSLKDTTEVNEGQTIDFTVSSGTPPTQDKEITVGFDLPTDRDTVRLTVQLNGTQVYDQEVSCAQGSVEVSLTGSGTGEVSYFWDGELQKTFTVQFT